MRSAFIQELMEVAAEDSRVWLLCGDLGYSVLEPFAEQYPDRFLNVGIAEQNMTGLAAGLAMTGKIVFTYSIANFSTLRCLEQIRNDVAYHGLSVIVVSVGGGLAYGSLGYSHHAVEDLAVMRSLPNMNVLAPGDPWETRSAVRALVAKSGPGYLRLGKANEPCIHSERPQLAPGVPVVAREGSDLTLVSTGGTLALAIEAAASLFQEGIQAEVLSLPYLSPFTPSQAAAIGERTGKVISIEEHVQGGLGGMLAENLCLSGCGARLIPLCLSGTTCGQVGSQESLRASQGLTVERIIKSAQHLMAA